MATETRIVLAVTCLVIGAAVGLGLSQYAPMFGGIERIGMPWSPARQSLIPVHVGFFAAIGLGVALFWARTSRS